MPCILIQHSKLILTFLFQNHNWNVSTQENQHFQVIDEMLLLFDCDVGSKNINFRSARSVLDIFNICIKKWGEKQNIIDMCNERRKKEIY